ncbi:MAG: heavy metal-responsive transcriptional regulator [Pyrinomonadaceae bacterium]|nr:heavy metal-responsive transcriptional regulator [Pyrinomonadaceae bacterium]
MLDPGTDSRLYTVRMSDGNSKKDYLRAGELARLAGVSTDTLRHYERKGVLPAPRRSHNNYRHYPPQALERVRLVRRALVVGFTLDELASILAARDQGGTPCPEVRTLAEEKLSQVETRLSELKILRNELRSTLKDWDIRLAETPAGERAGLLEALAANGHAAGMQTSPSALSRFKSKSKRRPRK